MHWHLLLLCTNRIHTISLPENRQGVGGCGLGVGSHPLGSGRDETGSSMGVRHGS